MLNPKSFHSRLSLPAVRYRPPATRRHPNTGLVMMNSGTLARLRPRLPIDVVPVRLLRGGIQTQVFPFCLT